MRVGQEKSKVTPNPQDGVSEWQVALFTLMSRDFFPEAVEVWEGR